MQAELTIDHLTFSYGDREVIRDLSLTLPAGTFSLLIGPTGCGKSTLLKIMAGLYPKYGGQLTSGQVSLGGRSQAMMFQEAGEQFTMATPREEIIFAMENLGKSKTEFADRLKLASEMGRAQDDSLFVFDEPTIGLHPLDVQTLLGVFQTLLSHGATVVVIEHDLDVIRNADYVIDMGPGGGEEGGRVVASGTPEDIRRAAESRTGRFL